MNNQVSFANRLLDWWDQHGRKDLPWQHNKTPYRVWVSEIMLQQTQVASVIEYYQRFMNTFPKLEDLAQAHEDIVLEHWAGLGYYARARNLHKTAKIIHEELSGDFPNTIEEITALPGIGRSTAGAILSIAFKERAPILDGNVKRVLCRHRAIEQWPGEKKVENQLWILADELTPSDRVADYTQAIMDLGATLCSRSKPQCEACPMQSDCEGLAQGIQTTLPKSKPKKAIPTKQTWILHMENAAGEIMLEKRPPSGIWGGLYSLPEHDFDASIDDITSAYQLKGFDILNIEKVKPFTHVFSHYKLEIHPVRLRVGSTHIEVKDGDSSVWRTTSQIEALGLPAPIEKYLTQNTQPELALSVE